MILYSKICKKIKIRDERKICIVNLGNGKSEEKTGPIDLNKLL